MHGIKNKIVFLHSTSIGNLMDGSPKVGGMAVQLYFWAKTFVEEGWTVYSMTKNKAYEKEGIRFLKYNSWGKLDILHEWFHTFWVYLRIRPDLVVERGAGRVLYPVARLAKFFKIKTVLFGASDVNFEPGKELISGGMRNKRLYRKGVPQVNHIVVQNEHQRQTLHDNYGREALVMPNIWGRIEAAGKANASDVVWVANLRPLKRPEWMLSAAKAMPNRTFTMVGGPDSKDHCYYESIKSEATTVDNVAFLGSMPFLATCDVVSKSKVLACTSTFEGFPNTFLQAWSYGIPVVSTVDPSGIIESNNLGIVVEKEEETIAALKRLLDNEKEYAEKCENVKAFFEKNYLSSDHYTHLMEYIDKQ